MFYNSIVCAIFMFMLQINFVQANDDLQKIVTYHTSEYGLHYVHHLNPKETIYSLSKFSGSSVQEIYNINGLNKATILSVGQELIIPVQNVAIITHKTNKNNTTISFVKVMYQVKKKDNLFQIAKRYFNTDINTLVNQNQLTGLTISPDQILHIGWMAIDNSFPVKVTPVIKQTASTENVKQALAISQVITKEAPTTIVKKTEVQHTTSDQTPREVVNSAIEEVNNDQNTGPIQHKYRVVQHTSIKDSNQTKAQMNSTTTVVSSSINAPVDTVSVTYSKSRSTSVKQTAIAPSVSSASMTKSNVSTESLNTSPPTTTVVATNSVNKTVEDESIKNRDYPDLSFLSSPNLLTNKGIAMWDKNDNEPLNMFILHQDARINSYIRIENPMLGRIVLAKVVARLPSNVYDADVKMVVSSAVANSLGVKDARFLAEMKYIR